MENIPVPCFMGFHIEQLVQDFFIDFVNRITHSVQVTNDIRQKPQTPYPKLKVVNQASHWYRETSVLKQNLMDIYCKKIDETCLDLGLRWEINESDD